MSLVKAIESDIARTESQAVMLGTCGLTFYELDMLVKHSGKCGQRG